MATHIGSVKFKNTVRFVSNIEGSSSVFATVGIRSVLHKPGEVNNIGLVMFGDVERGPERDVIPSGVNREYGYWRGNTNLSTLQSFDQLLIPLEGSGTYNGFPQVTVKTKSSGAGDESSSTCPDRDCVFMWDGDEWTEYANLCEEGLWGCSNSRWLLSGGYGNGCL